MTSPSLLPLAVLAPRRDRGSISGFVVVLTLAIVACGGLVVDGGRLVGAKIEASDHAENAARAGAQEVITRDGVAILDQPAAATRANSYLAAHGLTGVVAVTAGRITVTVNLVVPMTLLTLVDIAQKSVSATRSSAPVSP